MLYDFIYIILQPQGMCGYGERHSVTAHPRHTKTDGTRERGLRVDRKPINIHAGVRIRSPSQVHLAE